MSIHHLFTRTRDGETSICQDRVIDPLAAIRYLINAEFNFGSMVTLVTPTEIRTKSSCMGSVDDMIFNGSEEDMREMVRLTSAFKQVCESFKESGNLVVTTKDAIFNAHANKFLDCREICYPHQQGNGHHYR